ncbi:MAG: SpoIIE family protein phosphatase [candidate division Zixibacteria bacterium]|nr:SpoIIE family protein phosphatase [candidate division Zixibacteria bacterium]
MYLAEDTRLHRPVALKVLPKRLHGDPERLARLRIEAEAAARLNHPNIDTIYSIEEAEYTGAGDDTPKNRSILPEIEGFDVAAATRPSRGVGGDYYDVLKDQHGRLWIALGDVTGKGIPAALTMATLRTLFRAELEINQPLEAVLRRVADGLGRWTPPEVLATFCCGLLDPRRHALTLVNAAHPCPMVVRTDGAVEEAREAGPPAGLDPLMAADIRYTEQEVRLAPGETLLFYSDGVSEALNDAGELFGEERIAQLLGAHRHKTATGLLDVITQAVAAFQGNTPQSDDITLVVVRAV